MVDGYILYIRIKEPELVEVLFIYCEVNKSLSAIKISICFQIDENLHQLSLPSKVRIGRPSDDYINKAKSLITAFLQVKHGVNNRLPSAIHVFVPSHEVALI